MAPLLINISASEAERVDASLMRNGVAVVRGFIPQDHLAEMQRIADAATRPGFSYGAQNACTAIPAISQTTHEFRHRFLVCGLTMRLVTAGALLDIVEQRLGSRAIIHHGLFQRSLPVSCQILDGHIDCGSNKALNGTKKFDDTRIRMIVYLSDVSGGRFSYIVGSSADALKTFVPLRANQLFPPERVPADEARRATFNEPAGTLILFNTHGLDRPEVPKIARLVLNVWFARRDFSARLPAVLFSLAPVPPEQRERVYVFDGERGFDPVALSALAPAGTSSITRKIARRIVPHLGG